ncbi:cytidine/deoxycytidylate deaminase family protein [Actinidia rufa]|uniref:Riboflavin biosynthesis protein PYRD, chloroplastic n=1 Tax=Actinidia rufa TaxID=165716 RepID=A0A7J0G7V1_9ERIC|nr:cytidine/deoxycytidylate deaminase family protein [Actinidia rufa]
MGARKEREGGGLRWKEKEGGCCEVKAVARGGWDWAKLRVGVGVGRGGFNSCPGAKRVFRLVTGMRSHGGFVGVRCEVKDDGDDGFYMRRCVELARKAIGCTSPNPMVGCVIVKDGKIVGEGFHPKAGQSHAEVFALRDAGDLAENSTAYVSLEPCNHFGRTPPCTEALIKAKVKKVVVGMVDPNPIVVSKGLDRLRDAGIHVETGVEEELCKKLNEAYIHQTLRYSLSVDGHFSNQLGEEVTKSGGYYSLLLQEYDAVILSSNLLTANGLFPASKEPGANQPLQILISRNPRSPIQIPVFSTEAASKVIIFTDKETIV